jgi:hypothetical protein
MFNHCAKQNSHTNDILMMAHHNDLQNIKHTAKSHKYTFTTEHDHSWFFSSTKEAGRMLCTGWTGWTGWGRMHRMVSPLI